jgi:hypothetical protein
MYYVLECYPKPINVLTDTTYVYTNIV